jgi:hypothetical protein
MYDKLNHFALSLDCTPSFTEVTTNDTAILDSGCTSNFLSATAPCSDKQAAHFPLNVNMPNGTTIQSSHKCNLLITYFPPQARQAHILLGLVHNSLISVWQLCDNGCSVTFTQEQVTVSKNGKSVMYEAQDPRSRLWRVDLKQRFETNQVQCKHAHDNSTQKDLINYLHAVYFSPVKSTWISAIKNGNFTSWPGLTEQAVEKHLSKSTSTTKGHLNQKRQNARTTKVKDTNVIVTEPDLDHGIKTQFVYSATIDAGQIYTDETGIFPVVSSKVNKYIMILYDYDSNAILAQPTKNRTAPELLRAFQFMEHELVARGLKPKLMKLDNEASKLLKTYLHQQNITFQLVPPYSHRRNSAERAIRSFKDHLIAGICSTDKSFPMHLWDRLLPHAVITLNMLRTSRINPKLSASTHIDGQYDFNRAPMAPSGTRIIAHETPNRRLIWAPHGQDGWYIGPALEHYRCYTIYITKPRGERVVEIGDFFPDTSKLPFPSAQDLATKEAADLTHALLHPQPAGPFCKVGDEQTLALKRLADIFEGATRQTSKNVVPPTERVESVAPLRVQIAVSPPRLQNTTAQQIPTQQAISSHLTPNSNRRQHTPHIRAVTPPSPHVMVRRSAGQQYNLSQDMIAETINQATHCLSISTNPKPKNTVKLNGSHQIILLPEMANALICPETGKSIKHQELITKFRYKIKCMQSTANDINRLYNTNTIRFIRRSNIPKGRKVTYGSFVVDIKDHKE